MREFPRLGFIILLLGVNPFRFHSEMLYGSEYVKQIICKWDPQAIHLVASNLITHFGKGIVITTVKAILIKFHDGDISRRSTCVVASTEGKKDQDSTHHKVMNFF